MRRNRKGFTLVEIMIVVAIIARITATITTKFIDTIISLIG